MSSKLKPRLISSLTHRLVLWNFAGLLLALVIAVIFFDVIIRNNLEARLDRDLLTKLHEIKGLEETPLDMALFDSEIEHHSRAVGVGRVFYRLLDAENRVLAHSDLAAWPQGSLPDPPRTGISNREPYWETHHHLQSGLSARVLYKRLPQRRTVQIGLNTRELVSLSNRWRWVLMGAMLTVALLSFAFSVFVTSRMLRGIRKISDEVHEISRIGNFRRTIEPMLGSREANELAQAFNQVFAKIQELMESMEQILGDIAHDMRTPVSRMRGTAESVLSETDVSAREQELAGYTIQECDRILGLVNTILDINAAETHITSPGTQIFDLVKLVREGADLFAPMMEDKQQVLDLMVPDMSVWVRGSQAYMQRVLSNLLDNAIKYTPDKGRIALRLNRRKDGMLQMEVDDTGIGIATHESELIFKRFYRSDKSRTLPGNGLGLTFCRAAVSAMGGRIFHHPKESKGSLFIVELPEA